MNDIAVRIYLDDGTHTFVNVVPVTTIVSRTRDESFLHAVSSAAGEALGMLLANIATTPGWAEKINWAPEVHWSQPPE